MQSLALALRHLRPLSWPIEVQPPLRFSHLALSGARFFALLVRSSRRLAAGGRSSPVIGAPRRAATLWRSASLGAQGSPVIGRSGDQPPWHSAALALSHSGAQPLWRSAILALSHFGARPACLFLYACMYMNAHVFAAASSSFVCADLSLCFVVGLLLCFLVCLCAACFL